MMKLSNEKDITLKTQWGAFNFRIGYIIVRDEHILLQYSSSRDYWFVPGGRVSFGQDSRKSLVREVEEELGFTPKKFEKIMTVENFYPYAGTSIHEIAFYYRIDDSPLGKKLPTHEHDGRPIDLAWHKISDLPNITVKPEEISTQLHQLLEDGHHHIIHNGD